VIYFAAVRDLVGLSEEHVEVTDAEPHVGRLIEILLLRHPRLSMDGVRVAVNEEFVNADTALNDADVVALIPPVSGG
jgi:molybdopterin synthase sulfur carrier subunit